MLPFRSCTAIQQAFTVFESFNLSQGACLCKALCRSCNQQCLETLGKMMTCFFFSVRLDSKTLVCFEWNMEMSLKNGLRSYQSKRKSGLKKSFNLNKSWVTLQYQWRGESCDTRYSGCLKTGQTKKSTPKSFIADTTSISMHQHDFSILGFFRSMAGEPPSNLDPRIGGSSERYRHCLQGLRKNVGRWTFTTGVFFAERGLTTCLENISRISGHLFLIDWYNVYTYMQSRVASITECTVSICISYNLYRWIYNIHT